MIAALDVGTTKVCCFIARPGADGDLRIVGVGHQESKGVRSGVIVDMDAAEGSIRTTVAAAEKLAGENIDSVIVNISGGQPQSRRVAYEVSIAGHRIGESDLRRILDSVTMPAEQPLDRELVHAIPVGYSIDGNRGVRDPRGMFGGRLGVNMHVVTAAGSVTRNLMTCIQRCHLGVEAHVVSPFASALSCLVDDEKQLGVTLIDMGGGTTSIAVFHEGELIHTDSIPIGGFHVTQDIARGLKTPKANAERIKTYYGSAIPSPSDDREVIKAPLIGEEEDGEINEFPRSYLVEIIRARVEETFEILRARLEATGLDRMTARLVVLTGGASQLPGVRELAAMVLDKQVRLGRPAATEGLAESLGGPAFATGVGLLTYAVDGLPGAYDRAFRLTEEPGGRFGRIGQWIRDNF